MKKISFYTFYFLLFSLNIYAQPKYEFRGVWVATVDNIDWPSTKKLSTDSQKIEFIKLLDLHKANGMNAIIAQIRPATDAFYPSPYEPWSEWLTGTQGKPPMPYYDPLEFMIAETHKRGMEFHAWMNPYRAVFLLNRSSIAATHVTRLHPEWFLNYAGKKYFDPGNKDAQNFVINIVRDVVKRYEVDAIHFDDYFYPYREAGLEFPDNASFAKNGNGMTKNDWRRSNVDSIIYKLSKTIKQENAFCKFGISPFGVWRNIAKDPRGSNTKAGVTNYDDLYADILLWLENKWIDYAVPQLYWEIGFKVAPFEGLTDWWANNTFGRQLYIGHGFYRALEQRTGVWKTTTEIPKQIQKIREMPQVSGSVYFSSKSFNSNPGGWNDSLKNNYYKYPAIVPPMAWLDSTKPARPSVKFDSTKNSFKDSVRIYWNTTNNDLVNRYIIYKFTDTSRINSNDAKNISAIIISENLFFDFSLKTIPSDKNKIVIAISALTKTNNESKLSRLLYLERRGTGWQVFPVASNKQMK
ncbi:family 10 glycosylhydrolase [soil metagenome]